MTENLFMRIIYDEIHPTNPPYFVRCPNEWYMKNPKKYPEVFALIERLQKAIGVYTFLGIETANLHPYCDKVVLTTLLIDDVEYPQYLYTPFGTFVLIFFLKDEDGILREIEPIAFIEELKEYLFLTPCLMNGDENNCEVLYIHENASIPYPPEKPDIYLPDMDKYQAARKYWEAIEDLNQDEISINPDYFLNEPYEEDGHPLVFSSVDRAFDYLSEVLEYDEDIEDDCFIVEENFKDYLVHV